MSDAARQELAADLMRLGDESDTETVRDMLIDRLGEAFDPGAHLFLTLLLLVMRLKRCLVILCAD